MIKSLKTYLLISLLFNITMTQAQEPIKEQQVEEFINLGRDSIIQIALSIADKDIGLDNFSKIKVITNGSDIYVSFLNPIKYLPLGSVFYFDITISILDKFISYGPTSNGPADSDKKIAFYQETTESITNIQFVIDAINKSEEIGSVDISSFEDNMIIREQDKFYEIIVVSETTESSYKIEKLTGKLYDAIHAHLEPAPIEKGLEEKFIEIR